MRLVASSNPDDVGRDQALHLLTERAVLTRAVCRELMDFRRRVPRKAPVCRSRPAVTVG